jgi:hypothetical protein
VESRFRHHRHLLISAIVRFKFALHELVGVLATAVLVSHFHEIVSVSHLLLIVVLDSTFRLELVLSIFAIQISSNVGTNWNVHVMELFMMILEQFVITPNLIFPFANYEHHQILEMVVFSLHDACQGTGIFHIVRFLYVLVFQVFETIAARFVEFHFATFITIFCHPIRAFFHVEMSV